MYTAIILYYTFMRISFIFLESMYVCDKIEQINHKVNYKSCNMAPVAAAMSMIKVINRCCGPS